MSDKALDILRQAGAVLKDDHFVYTSGRHGSEYVNKDAAYPDPDHVDGLCRLIAEKFFQTEAAHRYSIDGVVVPAVGAIDLKTGTTRWLGKLSGRSGIFGIYAEHDEESVRKGPKDKSEIVEVHAGDEHPKVVKLEPGCELVIKKPGFVIKRGYDKYLIGGKRVIVVEDVLTTGGSARETVGAVRRAGGVVLAVIAICNRGGVKAEDLDVPELDALVNVTMETHQEDECPLCAKGVPVNVELGKGKQFLARKTQTG